MKKFTPRNQLDLFSEPELQEWREVPQGIFLLWTPRQQYTYCANRDLDSARIADNEGSANWFRARAASYMEEAATK